jgi:hypothetical protein
MTAREPIETTNLAEPGMAPIPWSRARDLLSGGAEGTEAVYFLGTIGPDGRPHSAAFGAAWHDGDLYFQTGAQTRKARNVTANPACTVSVRLPGIDVVIEGEAHRITDAPTLEGVTAAWRDGGWPAEVSGEGITAPYNAPGTGPPPWHVFRITMHTVFGIATAEPYGASRWRF